MYSFLIPLYHLHYFHEYFIYIQHIPVLLLFLYEIKNKSYLVFFNRGEIMPEHEELINSSEHQQL